MSPWIQWLLSITAFIAATAIILCGLYFLLVKVPIVSRFLGMFNRNVSSDGK